MKAFNNGWCHALFRSCRLALALFSLWTILCSTLVVVGAREQQQQTQALRLSGERRVLHVLNRLGFGARPTDIERVRAMGVEQYIKLQLSPEQIKDEVAEAKLRDLPSLKMSIAELYTKYPQPGMLLRKMERSGSLPAELAALRDKRAKGAATASNAGAASMMGDTEAIATPSKDEMAEAKAGQGADRKEYRRAIRDYYLQNGLQPPQRLVAELQASRILRAVYSERQLQEVMVDFWSNHFNVFAGKGADKWLLISYDRDTIRPNALGKFRDLLQATAESPAMLFYLDNFRSVSPNAPTRNRMGQQRRRNELLNGLRRRRPGGGALDPNAGQGEQDAAEMNASKGSEQEARQQKRPRRGINENYARELMELHTLGVDGGYTQRDVQEVARCFTGWTINNPRGRGAGQSADAGKFYFNPRLHDDGEKIVLGHKIPAGGGIRDGLMVLDILAHHPATSKFIATKLARRFVTDNPSPALVERISAAFTKSDGDMRETLGAIFSAPEFNAPEAYRAKIKTPFELAVSAIRALGAETNGNPALHRWIAKMGEGLYQYQAPTGYPDTAEDWVNAGSLLERLNYGLALAGNRIPGTRVSFERFLREEARTGSAADKARMMDHFLNVLLQGDVSPNTKRTLMKQLEEAAPTAQTGMERDADTTEEANSRAARRQLARTGATASEPHVVKIVGLILGSPEFQRQ